MSADKNELKLDSLFNEHVFRTLSYSLTGFVVGVGASLFFKHKVPVLFFGAGIGAGQGVFEFQRELQNYRLVRHEALTRRTIQIPPQPIVRAVQPAVETPIQPVVIQVQTPVQARTEVQTVPKQE